MSDAHLICAPCFFIAALFQIFYFALPSYSYLSWAFYCFSSQHLFAFIVQLWKPFQIAINFDLYNILITMRSLFHQFFEFNGNTVSRWLKLSLNSVPTDLSRSYPYNLLHSLLPPAPNWESETSASCFVLYPTEYELWLSCSFCERVTGLLKKMKHKLNLCLRLSWVRV